MSLNCPGARVAAAGLLAGLTVLLGATAPGAGAQTPAQPQAGPGVRVSDACEWRVSDRTRKANAALTGLGRTRRIIVSDTLLSRYSDDEVEGILAHELGHLVRRDIWRGMALHVAVAGAGLLAASRALAALASPLGWTGESDVAGLPALLLTTGAVSLALRPLSNAFSRRMERQADRFAIELTGNPAAFASAIERLGEQNLSEERPPRLARWFFYTHPPAAERVAAAKARLGGGQR